MQEFFPGDILFYKQLPDNWFDEAIIFTEGNKAQFVHVAIALSAVQKIEALSGGVMLNQINNSNVDAVWRYTQEVRTYDRYALHNALTWLIGQKGNRYAWLDCANILLEKYHLPFVFATSNLLFCSGLADEFLIRCITVPDVIRTSNPHEVTPQLLFDMLTGNRLPA